MLTCTAPLALTCCFLCLCVDALPYSCMLPVRGRDWGDRDSDSGVLICCSCCEQQPHVMQIVCTPKPLVQHTGGTLMPVAH